jgi:hypothetical protein
VILTRFYAARRRLTLQSVIWQCKPARGGNLAILQDHRRL